MITIADASAILTRASIVDNRSFDETTARAWADTIHPDVTLADALKAVSHHQANSHEYLTPVHINDYVKALKKVRKERVQAVGAPDFPSGMTYEEEQVYRRHFHQLVGDGLSREDAHDAVDAEFGVSRVVKAIPAPPEVRQLLDRGFSPHLPEQCRVPQCPVCERMPVGTSTWAGDPA